MLKRSLLRLPVFFALIAGISSAQTASPTPSPTPSEAEIELKKNAISFLNETRGQLGSLRTLENRLGFSAELANLTWFIDETEAKNAYKVLFADFGDLISRYNSQAAQFSAQIQPNSLIDAGEEKVKFSRRFQIAMQMRQEIAMSVAEHDPEMALDFFSSSLASISDPELRKTVESGDSFFEGRLLTAIAAKDPDKAATYGIRSVRSGVNYQHLQLLKTLHAKKPERAAELAAAMLSAIKNEKTKDQNWIIYGLLEFGGSTLEASAKQGGKPAILNRSELRDLAEILAKAILEEEYPSGIGYVDEINKYAPARAAQIRTKFRLDPGSGANSAPSRRSDSAVNASSNSAPIAAEAPEVGAETVRSNYEKLAKGGLSKEQRDRVVEESRRIMMQESNREKKILGISALAAMVAKSGDKELAASLMRDAETFVDRQPVNYQDYLHVWILAGGYAQSEPEKAFPLIEDSIMRLNDTISAFIKVGEFIDRTNEMIIDGEVQVGAFGGSMVRGFDRTLSGANETLRQLAKADFDRTRQLPDRFDRPEIRMLARMLVIRAMFDVKQEGAEADPEKDQY